MSSTCAPETASRANWKSVSLEGLRCIDDASLKPHVEKYTWPERDGCAASDLCVPVDHRAAVPAAFAHPVQVLHMGSGRKLVKKPFETEEDMLADVRGLQLAGRVLERAGMGHVPRQLCAYDRRALCLYFRHMGDTAERLQQDCAPLGARVRCLLDACRQLRELNRAGLGHFDVKPTNVLYHRRTRRGCLIDFGSVRRFEQLADWYGLDDTFRYTEKYFPRHKVKEGCYVTVSAAYVDLFGMALTALDVLWPHVRRERGSALATAHYFVRRVCTREDVRSSMGVPRDPARVACLNAVCRMLVEPPQTPAQRRRFAAECRERSGDGGSKSMLSALLVLSPHPDGKRRVVHAAAAKCDPTPAWDAAIGHLEDAVSKLNSQ